MLLSFAGMELFTSPRYKGEAFDDALRALRDQAIEMANIKIYVCAATVELGQVEPSMESLDGVLSTPRFLGETAGQRLLFI